MPTSTHRRFFHFCSFRDFFFIDRKNPYSRSVPSDAAGEALEAALKTNTALATLQIHSGLSAAAAEALGAALKTNTALTTLQIRVRLGPAAAEAVAALKTNTALTTWQIR